MVLEYSSRRLPNNVGISFAVEGDHTVIVQMLLSTGQADTSINHDDAAHSPRKSLLDLAKYVIGPVKTGQIIAELHTEGTQVGTVVASGKGA